MFCLQVQHVCVVPKVVKRATDLEPALQRVRSHHCRCWVSNPDSARTSAALNTEPSLPSLEIFSNNKSVKIF